MKEAIFGPAGNAEEFYADGNKSSYQAPAWLAAYGLNAYEYQCGKGVLISEAMCKTIGEEAKKHEITLSLHAPYFISLSSVEPEKRRKSVHYILQSLRAAHAMGATLIVVHTGSAGKIPREKAMKLAADTIYLALNASAKEGFSPITIGLETMGKINQLGTLNEVLQLCQIDTSLRPAVDFGHLNARGLGAIKTEEDYEKIFDTIATTLSAEQAQKLHVHFSKIEYSKGGESKHLTFESDLFGPSPEQFSAVIARHQLTPTVICESAGTMAKDAKYLQNIYRSLL